MHDSLVNEYKLFYEGYDKTVKELSYPDIPINTNYFREEAIHFKKYGRYCDDPAGTPGHTMYWDEQERRCKEGYTVGGVTITGDHYAYLNFSQIKLTPEDNRKNGLISKEMPLRSMARRKIKDFPSFFDGDYFYFHVKDIAAALGRHLTVGKARRKGYSYKAGSVVANRFKMEANSVSIIGAYDDTYLTDADGTMTMAKNCLDFYNEHTDWARRKLINTVHVQKDGYTEILENGVKVDKGFKSIIIAQSCRQNADALRGKDGTLIYLEEAGKFPNMLEVLHSTRPTVEDGIYITGQIIVFGTGGGKDVNWEAFEKVFYEPELFNMMRFVNIWDEGFSDTFCSFFHPDYVSKVGFVDSKSGRSDMFAAKTYEEEQRAAINDSDDLSKYKMENPFSPREAFKRLSNNDFPKEALEVQLNKIRANKYYKSVGITGRINTSARGLRFDPDTNLHAIDDFPLKDEGKMAGAIVQYFPPFKQNGIVPNDLYIVCVDPFGVDKDNPTLKNSLGSIYVLCNPNKVVPHHSNRIMAQFNGRPDKQDTFNEVIFLLAQYYNAQVGYENDRGNVLDYVKRHRHLFKYLQPEFELAWDDKINNKMGRGYGMSMKDKNTRLQGDVYIREWLLSPRGETQDGETIYTYQTINDVALLLELIKYDVNNPTIYNRVAALRIGMYHMKELIYANKTAGETNRITRASIYNTELF